MENRFWSISTPEEQGMDSSEICDLIEEVKENHKSVHNLVIIRNRNIVTDVSFEPYKKEILHDLYSCSKSVASTLIGIAIEEGKLSSVKESALKFFPAVKVEEGLERKRSITIENLLTMATGIEWDDRENYDEMCDSEDPAAYFWNRPMSKDPGINFCYCSAVPHILEWIIEKVTGEDILTYAKRMLFTPLQISRICWPSFGQNLRAGLMLAPRDMAKFGQVFLNHGRWEDHQIVSEEWIKAATAKHIDTPDDMDFVSNFGAGYGYQWWQNSFGGFHANGFGGQYIFIVPSEELIVVFTGAMFGEDFYLPQMWMEKYIMLSIKKKMSKKEIPKVNPVLYSVIQFPATGQSEELKAKELPPIIKQISGQTYILESTKRSDALYNAPGDSSQVLGESRNVNSGDSITFLFNENKECSLRIKETAREQELTIGLEEKHHVHLCKVLDVSEEIEEGWVALKGHWENGRTFQLDIRYLYNAEKIKKNYIFQGNTVTIETYFLGRCVERCRGICSLPYLK